MRRLLVTTHFSSVSDKRVDSGLQAYNVESQHLEWSVTGRVGDSEKDINPCGVTTDGRGHLLICDPVNGCIQMFSTDGVYLGCLVEKGEHGIGDLRHVRWCKKTSSLIVAHQKHVLNLGYRNYISILKTDLK